MKAFLECIPCFIRQSIEAARLATDDRDLQEVILDRVLEVARQVDLNEPAPAAGQAIHRVVRELSGNPDPYRQAKQRANQAALALYPKLKAMVEHSPQRFETAVRVAIAGNTIDMAAFSELGLQEMEAAVQHALDASLDTELVGELRQCLAEAQHILYLADNAGEIAFDRVLIEELPGERTIAAVRGSAVLNDVTLTDAEEVGLTDVVKVVGNGSDAPATLLRDCSAEFRRLFEEADVIIAKGMGNYETLNDRDGNVFFLFRAKCPSIAEDAGVPLGSLVICRGKARPEHAGSA